MIRLFFLLCLTGLFSETARAQRPTIAVENIEHFDPYFEDNALRVVDFIARRISQGEKFQLVERENFSEVLSEQERQKNEGFIDGETVEQGKLVGAQYLIRLNYEEEAATLGMRMLNVESGEILCTQTYELKELMQEYELTTGFWSGLTSDLETCSAQLSSKGSEAVFQIVEELKVKSSIPVILVYGDDTRSVKRGERLVIYHNVQKKLGNKTVDYPEEVGEITVREVENGNFFNAIVIEGSEQLKSLLADKIEIYAKLRD